MAGQTPAPAATLTKRRDSLTFVYSVTFRRVIDAGTIEVRWPPGRKGDTQRLCLTGVRVPARHSPAGHDARIWVEDWITEHTVVDPPSLMVAIQRPWGGGRRWRKIPARIYPPGSACLNEDIITAGHGWPV